MVLQGCLLEILRKTVECRHNREQTVLQIFAVTVQCNMMILAVKKGNIQPVYLMEGTEEYIKQQAVRQLCAKLLPAGLEELLSRAQTGQRSENI